MQTAYIQERRSIPILVPEKTNQLPSPKSNECSLKYNLFDPNINSPPSEWMMKLQYRIDNYYNDKRVCNSSKK
jgi:hypothetical protein